MTQTCCECPGVSGGGISWQGSAAGFGALSIAVPAWGLLEEVAIIFITSTIVWPQVKWQSTPVLLPGKFHGLRSLVGYSPWGRKELDTTEQLHFTSLLQITGREHSPTPQQKIALKIY